MYYTVKKLSTELGSWICQLEISKKKILRLFL